MRKFKRHPPVDPWTLEEFDRLSERLLYDPVIDASISRDPLEIRLNGETVFLPGDVIIKVSFNEDTFYLEFPTFLLTKEMCCRIWDNINKHKNKP